MDPERRVGLEPGATEPPMAPRLRAGAAAAHAAYIGLAAFALHVCPVFSASFLLAVSSLLSTTLFLFVRGRLRLWPLGVFLAPLGVAFLLSTFFMLRPEASVGVRSHLGPTFVVLHVLSNLGGTALFLLACGVAVLFLVQERRLKQKKLHRGGSALPPLDALDRAVHRLLLAGFPLLTLGVVSGTFWAPDLLAGGADRVLRAVLGYATWLVAAVVLTLRAVAGWRGRRAAYGTIAGFACAAAVLAIYLVRPSEGG